MKKLVVLLSVIMLTVGSMAARDRVYNTSEPLPEAARNMIKKHFPKLKVNHVKVDKDMFSTEYEAILSDGTEIDFDSKGEWDAIDRGNKAVPEALVLQPIREYVAKNYPGQKIVDIDKDHSSYEISLSNGLELKFDRAGNFKRIDD